MLEISYNVFMDLVSSSKQGFLSAPDHFSHEK